MAFFITPCTELGLKPGDIGGIGASFVDCVKKSDLNLFRL
jgi:hypothetical protein